DARQVDRTAILRLEAGAERRVRARPLQATAVVALVRIGGAASVVTFGIALLDPADRTALAGVDEDHPACRIDRAAAPVRPAVVRHVDRGLRRVALPVEEERRERAGVEERPAVGIEQRAAGRGVLGGRTA